MTDLTLENIAKHEASHAAMAYFVGRTVGLVSIREAEQHLGVTFHGPARRVLSRVEGLYLLPPPLWPADLRRLVETDLLITLAGNLSGWVIPAEDAPITASALPPPVTSITAPSKRETTSLEESEVTAKPSDAETAERLIRVLTVADPTLRSETSAYYWALTHSIVCSPRFRILVAALVPVLLEREIVGGRATREIFRAVDPEYRPPRLQAAARVKEE